MPLVLLLAIAVTAGLTGWLVARLYARSASTPAAPTLEAAQKVGESVGRHPRLRRFLRARIDPTAMTGLLLTLALLVAIGGGVLLGALAYATRTNSDLTGIDNSVAKWGNRHATPFSTHALNGITQLGGIYAIIGLCVVLAVVATIRQRNIWIPIFIVAVIGGEEILTLTVKQLDDRLRPTFNPAAATLGPSFPSGHSATAAAFYATAAFVIGRRLSPRVRAVLIGLAVGTAVAVAASRVLLDFHWLTDVIAGLGLGWAWFAVCAIAFGGRMLRFGATAETAAEVADATSRSRAGPVNSDRRSGSNRAATRSTSA